MKRRKHVLMLLWCGLSLVAVSSLYAQGRVYVASSAEGSRLKTTSTQWSDIPLMLIQFTNEYPGNACIGFSFYAEVSNNGRIWFTSVIDGQQASPQQVMVKPTSMGTHSFMFSKNLTAGPHTVVMRYAVDAGSEGELRDHSLWVATAPQVLNAITAPVGPDISTTSSQYEDLPNGSLNLTLPVAGDIVVSLSAMMSTNADFGRVYLRALVDAQYAEPDEYLLYRGYPGFQGESQLRCCTFVRRNLSSGLHALRLQWRVEPGKLGTMSARTITVYLGNSAAIAQGKGGVMSVSGNAEVASSADAYTTIPDMNLGLYFPARSAVVVSMTAEARCQLIADLTFPFPRSVPLEVRLTVDNVAVTTSDSLFTVMSILDTTGTNSYSFVLPDVDPGNHQFALRWHGAPGNWSIPPSMGHRNMTILTFPVPSASGVDENSHALIPADACLLQNYPNPFNPVTTIGFRVPGVVNGSGVSGLGSSHVRLSVYDLLGREVAVLADEEKAPGEYHATFDGAGLASGMYSYRLTAGSYVETKRAVLMK